MSDDPAVRVSHTAEITTELGDRIGVWAHAGYVVIEIGRVIHSHLTVSEAREFMRLIADNCDLAETWDKETKI